MKTWQAAVDEGKRTVRWYPIEPYLGGDIEAISMVEAYMNAHDEIVIAPLVESFPPTVKNPKSVKAALLNIYPDAIFSSDAPVILDGKSEDDAIH